MGLYTHCKDFLQVGWVYPHVGSLDHGTYYPPFCPWFLATKTCYKTCLDWKLLLFLFGFRAGWKSISLISWVVKSPSNFMIAGFGWTKQYNQILHHRKLTNSSPRKGPSQKQISSSNHYFSGDKLVFGGVSVTIERNSKGFQNSCL